MKLKEVLVAAAIVSSVFAGCTKERTMNDSGNLVAKTVDEDASLPQIAVNGTQLHAEAFGLPDDPLLIVLHGGPGADYRSLLNCKAFSNQGYRVVFYDQRGSGLSKRHPKNSYSLQLMYDDLSAVIAHYRTKPTQKVFLLGHSWGAMLATAYINQYPTRANGAIMAEPGGLVWKDVVDYFEESRKGKVTSELLNDLFYVDQFITGKQSEHAVLDYKFGLLGVADGNKDNPTGNEGKLLGWRSGFIVNFAFFDIGERDEPDFTTNLSQFTTKVLFVYSENNKAYGLSRAQKVAAAFSSVQLLKINGAGHDMLSFPTGWNNFYPTALTYLNSLK